ncbi:enoyl-CoA hydratase-related protein [Actinomycetospora sp. C-140]
MVRAEISGVATIALDRPPHNALTPGLAAALIEALGACHADARVRAIVLTGYGETFSVGSDLTHGPETPRRLLDADGADLSGYDDPAGRVVKVMAGLDVPVVAALNGDAVGAGALTALAADVRFATPEARIGFPFTRLGVCPGGASTYRLPHVVGAGRAADWLLSGRLVDTSEAVAAGFLSSTMTLDYLVAWAQEWAGKIASRTSSTAVAATRALLRSTPVDPDAAAAAESRAMSDLIGSPDCAEGVASFVERRRPRFAPRVPPP